jgi:nitrogen regulatory protein P-II 1
MRKVSLPVVGGSTFREPVTLAYGKVAFHQVRKVWHTGPRMQKIEAVIQPSKLDAVKDALLEAGIEGMTILEARGHGRQKGHTEFYRGREYTVDLLPKIKLELVVADEMVQRAVQAILSAARSGKIGDGKIFISRIDEAIRIRNDERGETAL